MRAVVIRQFGEPKQLKVEEVPTPQPRGDEVLVEVRAAGINPSDVKNVAGTMHGTTLPRVPGRDFAGVVARGPDDLVGKEVWGSGGDIGFTRDGTHAEFILLPRDAVVLKPASMSMDSVGSAGLIFVTAWSTMVSAAAIRSGETALIIGAAGGVGGAAVQIAKSHGARVIGVVRSDEDAEIARKFGADEAINSKTVNLAEAVATLTNQRRADVVFDTSGTMFEQAVEAAGIHGRIPVITAPRDGRATFNLRSIYRKMLHILGVDTRPIDAVVAAQMLAQMTKYFDMGQFKASEGIGYPLSQVVEAYEHAGRGGSRVFLRPVS